jgi:hypothetical protein
MRKEEKYNLPQATDLEQEYAGSYHIAVRSDNLAGLGQGQVEVNRKSLAERTLKEFKRQATGRPSNLVLDPPAKGSKGMPQIRQTIIDSADEDSADGDADGNLGQPKPDKNPEMWKSILRVIDYRTEADHARRKEHVSLKIWFRQGIMTVILITGVLAIFDVDFAGPNPPYYAQRFPVIIELVGYLPYINLVINLIFIGECVATVNLFGWDYFCGMSKETFQPSLDEIGWTTLDYGIVTIGVGELFSFFGLVDASNDTQVLKIARMARLLRLVKTLKFVKGFSLPAILAEAMFATSGLICGIFIFVIIIIANGGMVLNQAGIPEDKLDPNVMEMGFNRPWWDNWRTYLGTIGSAMFTMLTLMTGEGYGNRYGGALVRGPCWSGIESYDEFYEDTRYTSATRINSMVIGTVAFCFISGTAMFSVLTGVITEKVTKLYANSYGSIATEKKKMQQVRENLRLFVNAIDRDQDGYLDQAEVISAFESNTMNKIFIYLGVDKEDMIKLFDASDPDGKGTIKKSIFIDICLKMRGEANMIDFYSCYTLLGNVIRRANELQDRAGNLTSALDLAVDQVQWHEDRYDNTEHEKIEKAKSEMDRENYAKTKDRMYQSLDKSFFSQDLV